MIRSKNYKNILLSKITLKYSYAFKERIELSWCITKNIQNPFNRIVM